MTELSPSVREFLTDAVQNLPAGEETERAEFESLPSMAKVFQKEYVVSYFKFLLHEKPYGDVVGEARNVLHTFDGWKERETAKITADPGMDESALKWLALEGINYYTFKRVSLEMLEQFEVLRANGLSSEAANGMRSWMHVEAISQAVIDMFEENQREV